MSLEVSRRTSPYGMTGGGKFGRDGLLDRCKGAPFSGQEGIGSPGEGKISVGAKAVSLEVSRRTSPYGLSGGGELGRNGVGDGCKGAPFLGREACAGSPTRFGGGNGSPCEGDSSLSPGESGFRWRCDKYEDASLIPGLPEDVAQRCIALVRRADFPAVRKVSRAWWDLVHTREFYRTRKGLGTLEDWLYVLTVAENLKCTQWEVLNPKQQDNWRVLPRMPGPVKMASRSIVVNEKLLVIGGLVMDDETAFASGDVYIYDPVLDSWKKAANMKSARYEFGCGVVDDRVYVVGGHGADGEALASMEVFDLERDEWTASSPLKRPRWGCFAAGVAGKLHVLGGRSKFTLGSARFINVFDPATGRWQEVKDGCSMVLAHAVLGGKIFCVEWKDERSLRCYDTATRAWSKVPLPLVVCKSACSYCLGTYGGKLQFFPSTSGDVPGPGHARNTLVYDPRAPKGSEWQSTSIKTRGACITCVNMEA